MWRLSKFAWKIYNDPASRFKLSVDISRHTEAAASANATSAVAQAYESGPVPAVAIVVAAVVIVAFIGLVLRQRKKALF